MFLDTTHDSRDNDFLIDNLVGKAFSFFKALKLGGIGSKRMVVDLVSADLQHYMNTVSDVNYSSIELRPKGILVFFNRGLKNYTWVIPYPDLILHVENTMVIEAQSKKMRYRDDHFLKENAGFFNKLVEAKQAFEAGSNKTLLS